MEKIEIARKYLIPKNLEKNGLKKNQIKYSKEVILKIAEEYAREAGVRNFEKCVDKINRKVITENMSCAEKKFQNAKKEFKKSLKKGKKARKKTEKTHFYVAKIKKRNYLCHAKAQMAELVDALVSNTSGVTPMPVRSHPFSMSLGSF